LSTIINGEMLLCEKPTFILTKIRITRNKQLGNCRVS